MKRHRVLVTAAAARDIADIHAYVAKQDGDRRASQLLDRIEAVLGKLAKLPLRGNHPKELAALGIRDYRETRFKPYRVIYRVIEDSVYVLLVIDGGRDMQSLLARRLLED
jgi:toxin ParE1/3/4